MASMNVSKFHYHINRSDSYAMRDYTTNTSNRFRSYNRAKSPFAPIMAKEAGEISEMDLQPVNCIHLLNSLYRMSNMSSTPCWPSC
jgi:hypothetical protein